MPKTLVELVFSKGQLHIVQTGEVSLNPQMLSGIVTLSYPGPDYASDDGESLRTKEIRGTANHLKLNANAYLGSIQLSNRGVVGGDSYSPVMYFHIDDEQARNVPQPKPVYRSHSYEGCCDSEAE